MMAAIILIPVDAVFAKEVAKPRSKPEVAQKQRQSGGARSKSMQIIKAASKDRWSEARQLAANANDPLASKLYMWLMLSDMKSTDWTNETFIRLSHFIRKNPSWPGIAKMKVAAEGAMPENLPNDEVIAWYEDFEPKTGYGLDRYMSALIINGRKEQARGFIANWWATTTLPRDAQKTVFQKYHSYISREAHAKRLDLLLLKENYESAQAVAGVLGKGYPELALARIALAKSEPGAAALVNKVPSHLQNDAGLLYERLRWRRKKDLNPEAIDILMHQPALAKIQNPEEWWKERHIMIRRMLEQKNYKKAYILASKHGLKDGATFAEAEWLSGWLALRFAKDTSTAIKHFSRMYESVESPMSKARGAYWAGRAAQAKGKDDAAKEWFGRAAKYPNYFYGQMAGAALMHESALPKDKGAKPSDSDRAKFENDELMQVYRMFYDADDRDRARKFLQAFLDHNDSPQAYYFAAEHAASKGDYYDAVKISKDAARKGLFLTRQAYPTVADWLKGITNVEWALVHSLIRQESMFDQYAQSSVGALGLMQLMPATAKETSGKLGIGYDKAWLTSRPSYNITLGTSYIERLLRRYDGYYPMAIAAYNAGPARVSDWIDAFGDPRKGEIDPIDWIELIPIYETRNYVQRVMEGVYIYRLRLKGIQSHPKTPIHVSYDIQN